mgnify:CR=1 FL=1
MGSATYDPSITEETVRELSSNSFVIKAYPSQTYTEYFRRYERGRWVYYYQVQMLVKYDRDEVARVAQDAMRRTLARLMESASDPAERNKIQQSIDTVQSGPPPSLPVPVSSPSEGSIWALLVGIDRYEKGISPLQFAARDARLFADALKGVTPEEQVWLMTHEMTYDNTQSYKRCGRYLAS